MRMSEHTLTGLVSPRLLLSAKQNLQADDAEYNDQVEVEDVRNTESKTQDNADNSGPTSKPPH